VDALRAPLSAALGVHETDAKVRWLFLGVSVLALLASIGSGLYGGWGPCGPATLEGMILMAVGILGILGSGALLTAGY
jgi:hypothetical protein